MLFSDTNDSRIWLQMTCRFFERDNRKTLIIIRHVVGTNATTYKKPFKLNRPVVCFTFFFLSKLSLRITMTMPIELVRFWFTDSVDRNINIDIVIEVLIYNNVDINGYLRKKKEYSNKTYNFYWNFIKYQNN